MSCSELTLGERAAYIADRYNWPLEARQLEKGTVPEGFRKEVAKAIVLFKSRGHFYDWDYVEDDKYHTGQLVSLRILISKMNTQALQHPEESATIEASETTIHPES